MKRLLTIGAIIVLTGCVADKEESLVPPGGTRTVVFQCDGGAPLTVDFAEGAALLKVNGSSLQLDQQPSGSGVHYSGAGNDLRGKGSDMTWTDSAGAVHQCHDQLSTQRQAPETSEPKS
jgi:membrane-bound inhibitor of C-type lysozyme